MCVCVCVHCPNIEPLESSLYICRIAKPAWVQLHSSRLFAVRLSNSERTPFISRPSRRCVQGCSDTYLQVCHGPTSSLLEIHAVTSCFLPLVHQCSRMPGWKNDNKNVTFFYLFMYFWGCMRLVVLSPTVIKDNTVDSYMKYTSTVHWAFTGYLKEPLTNSLN